MFTLTRLISTSLFVLVLTGTALAQENRAPVETPQEPMASREPLAAGPLVTATVTAKRVRFVSPGSVVQLRLEVFNEAGQKLFDTELRGGNVLDWYLQDGAGERVPAGSYASVLTTKSLSGRMSQRVGLVKVNDRKEVIEGPELSQLSQLSIAQQQTIGPIEGNAALTFLQQTEAEAITTATHDGTDGQLTSTRGALTFRTGDVFAGKDVERVRITPEGNVGIGTDKPEATLDVAGTIRATGALRTAAGLQFADGSQLTSSEGKLRHTTTTTDEPQAVVDGTGTTGRITKWTNGGAATLGDSLLGESGNRVELRSPAAGTGINPSFVNPNNIGGFSLLQAYPTTGANANLSFAVVPRGTGAATNRAQLSVFNTDFIADSTNYEFASLRARGTDFVFGTGKNGTGQNLPFMFAAGFLSDNTTNNGQFYLAANGNVGIGTTTPAEKLDVLGSIKASGSLTGATGSVTGNLTVDTNTLHVDATNNRVGIGTITPGAPLDVVGDINTSTQFNIGGIHILSNAGSHNLFAGEGAGAVNTSFNNSFFGKNAGNANTTGSGNSFFGAFAGANNTTAGGNSFFGLNAGIANTTGSSNSFFGYTAGQANTTGTSNSFFGYTAGSSNTTGASNAFFGFFAGQNNTTGTNNSFFGLQAGWHNTTSLDNAFFGKSAGAGNTTGASNSFFGTLSGTANTTASFNSFFGNSAGSDNTTGASNSFFGSSAGAANTTGQNNSFFGKSAGAANTTAHNNAFFGTSAGAANTGSSNSFFGNSAGAANTTGASNSFFGNTAGTLNTTGASNSFFGNGAGAANTTEIGNSFFGKSGGAANTTGFNSFFGNNAGAANTGGSFNSFFGSSAGAVNTGGGNNAFFGNSAGAANTTGGNNSFFGNSAGGANSTGLNNSFFGNSAGFANLASGNSFFGSSAGTANTTGDENSFFGENAGDSNTTGDNNSFFGNTAGSDNTTGENNSFLGKSAGSGNTTGSTNTFVGVNAGSLNTTENANTFVGANSNGAAAITNATAVGANASVTQSDSLVLGSGVKVGAGISAPKEKLHTLGGNIFIDGVAGGNDNGLILKSPNGATCAKLTINNAGSPVTAIIPCP